MFILLIFVIFMIMIYYGKSKYFVKEDNKEQLPRITKKKSLTAVPINKKIFVTFQGSKYDITSFAKKHPGGKTVLVENNGKDIEQLMIENGHSDNAYKTLDTFKIQE